MDKQPSPLKSQMKSNAKQIRVHGASRVEPSGHEPANFVFYSNPILALMCMPARRPSDIPLHDAARISGVHPDLLLYYCRLGLLGAKRAGEGRSALFDAEALDGIGRIEHYRRRLGVRRRALHLVEELWREGERLQIEIEFLRPQDVPSPV